MDEMLDSVRSFGLSILATCLNASDLCSVKVLKSDMPPCSEYCISILRIIKHRLHVCTRHSFSELFDSRRRDIVFPGDMFPKSEDWDDEEYEENHVTTGQRKANKSEGKPGVMTRWR